MYVVCVTLHVKPEFRELFIEATFDNARNARREAGNIRFDVLESEEDPNRFFFYEAYVVKEDFAAHQKTEHYVRWRDAVADWMAEPRQGLRHRSLFFGDEETNEPAMGHQ